MDGKTLRGSGPTRVLIVDDHPVVRSGLAAVIGDEADLDVCGEAAGVAEALKVAATTRPDLMVIDISLKDGSGLDLIHQVKAEHPTIRMLAVSMHDETLFARRAFQAGASGYLNKGEASSEIIAAIRQILKGKVYMSARLAQGMLHLSQKEADTASGPQVDALSNRELEVFGLIGEGMSTRQIAQRLHVSHKTIETHRENIKKKLNLETGNELVRHAMLWTWEQTNQPSRIAPTDT